LGFLVLETNHLATLVGTVAAESNNDTARTDRNRLTGRLEIIRLSCVRWEVFEIILGELFFIILKAFKKLFT
jgi:hypothetical protein